MKHKIEDWRASWKCWRRITKDSANIRAQPWSEAVGIEEIDEELAVPGIVCWFSRGWAFDEEQTIHIADHVIALHNAWVKDRKKK